MTTASDISDYALLRLMPSADYGIALKTQAAMALTAINASITKMGLNATATLQGSVAKGTWCGQTADIDIFIHLPVDTSAEFFAKAAYTIAEHAFGPGTIMERKVASHPYVTVLANEFEIDVVPCYAVKSAVEIVGATDRTPYHTQWVLANTDAYLRDEIRKTKLFFQGINVYGADSFTGGFSGYACEVMTIKYGSFIELLSRMVSLASRNLPDPTDPQRNILASVRQDVMERAILLSYEYLGNPMFGYFVGQMHWNATPADNYWMYRHSEPLNNEDAAALRASIQKKLNAARDYGFEIQEQHYFLDDNMFTAFIQVPNLEPAREHHSPPVLMQEAYSAWLNKWINEDDALVVYNQSTGGQIAITQETRQTIRVFTQMNWTPMSIASMVPYMTRLQTGMRDV